MVTRWQAVAQGHVEIWWDAKGAPQGGPPRGSLAPPLPVFLVCHISDVMRLGAQAKGRKAKAPFRLLVAYTTAQVPFFGVSHPQAWLLSSMRKPQDPSLRKVGGDGEGGRRAMEAAGSSDDMPSCIAQRRWHS